MSQLQKPEEVLIIDIDIESGTNSVYVELASQDMIEAFKQIDGKICLGEKISVRKIGEETTKTNAQAAVIALKALNLITGSKIQKSNTEKLEDEDEEILLGPQTLEAKASSL